MFAASTNTLRRQLFMSAFIIGITVGVTACTAFTPPEVRTLDMVEGALDLDDVICRRSYSPNFLEANPYSRSISVEGATKSTEIIARLEDLKFARNSGGVGTDHETFEGPGSVSVNLYIYLPDTAGSDSAFGQDRTCIVPDAGLVNVFIAVQ